MILGRLAAAIVVLGLIAPCATHAKESSRFVTAAMRARAAENAKKHAWARDLQAGAVAAAQRWVSMSDEYIVPTTAALDR